MLKGISLLIHQKSKDINYTVILCKIYENILKTSYYETNSEKHRDIRKNKNSKRVSKIHVFLDGHEKEKFKT